MKISTKGRYALRVIIDLAEHRSGEYIPMKEVAARQDISLKYIEKIMPLLTKNGLVEGIHGKGGGYRLTKAPAEYTVESILRTTKDSMAPVSCLEPGAEACPRAAECRTLSMWRGLDRLITQYFEHIVLADLMHGGADGGDYVI